MEYNSGRPKMIIPEYGRHIQKMVDFATSIKDKEERNKCARSIIDVMGQLNPHLRDVADFKHKLWDHLFIMSNFNLDVDSPYEIPSPEILNEKPDALEYPSGKIKNKHYGKIVIELIEKAKSYDEGEEKQSLVDAIANLMKRHYLTWNNKSISDEIILKDLKSMSTGTLEVSKDFEFASTSDILTRQPARPKKRKNQGHHRQNNKGKRKY